MPLGQRRRCSTEVQLSGVDAGWNVERWLRLPVRSRRRVTLSTQVGDGSRDPDIPALHPTLADDDVDGRNFHRRLRHPTRRPEPPRTRPPGRDS